MISDVLRGENRGRTLDHVAVVRSLIDVGRLEPRPFGLDLPLTGELERWAGKRLVVFIQEEEVGKIHGAAFRLLSSADTN